MLVCSGQRLVTFSFILLVSITTRVVGDEGERPIVKTKQGPIQGQVVTNSNGLSYIAFRGIPFAKPPVGELRFKRPEVAEPWEGVREGDRDGPMCTQYNYLEDDIAGEEDCLYLNVYTPQIPNSRDDSRAVMVYIHGGGFQAGSGGADVAGPGRFMDHEVVIVSISFRLGVFGFLSTEDEASPGNYGLWDQVIALRWIQDNIEEFGGNPGRVTMFGESSGGASVSYLILSPHAKDLFHGAIIQSGTALNPWALEENPLRHARTLAEKVDCPSKDNHQMVECLRNKPQDDVLTAYTQFAVSPTILPFFFTPVVEKQGDEGFINDTPLNILKEGNFNRVPTIAGLTENEGAAFVSTLKMHYPFDGTLLSDRLGEIISNISDFKGALPAVGERIKKEYLDDIDVKDPAALTLALNNLYSDSLFNAGTDQFLRLISKQGVATYMYLYTYRAKTSFAAVLGSQESTAPSHGDSLILLFELPIFAKKPLEGDDKVVSHNMLTLWTTFAKTSMPTPGFSGLSDVRWVPLNPGELRYLTIDKELTMGDKFREDQTKLWNVILPKIAAGRRLGKDEL